MADIIQHNGIKILLTEAADTIEPLSEKLVADNMKKLIDYENLEEQGRLLKLPCAVGDKIYEIIEDDIPVYEVYIKEYEVQDISTKEVKYCDDWILIDYENLYFCYEDAVKKLAAMHGRTDND